MFCTNIVLKVASLCNLNCTYCYVYNKGDESYKRQPKIMSEIVVEETLKNIKTYYNVSFWNIYSCANILNRNFLFQKFIY